ncbi:MAG: hypothetical protein Q9M20_01385, partial [Mariprofundaceae bacterium]|nr:hypothetical protein [Mariprofundaceae bacterium]
ALRSTFRPEFLNRVDDVVLFKPLSRHDVEKIATLFVAQLQQRLLMQQVTLKLSSRAMSHIAQQAYDPCYGAMPMKRFIQQNLETPLAKLLISGEALSGSVVTVDCADDGLTLFSDSFLENKGED